MKFDSFLKRIRPEKKISVPKALNDESKIETPIIIIYDFAGYGAIITECIVNKFRNNGYYAVAIAEIETYRMPLPKAVPIKLHIHDVSIHVVQVKAK